MAASTPSRCLPQEVIVAEVLGLDIVMHQMDDGRFYPCGQERGRSPVHVRRRAGVAVEKYDVLLPVGHQGADAFSDESSVLRAGQHPGAYHCRFAECRSLSEVKAILSSVLKEGKLRPGQSHFDISASPRVILRAGASSVRRLRRHACYAPKRQKKKPRRRRRRERRKCRHIPKMP